MSQESSPVIMSYRQQLFLNYFVAILIDLVVLSFFNEYWHSAVQVSSFGVAFLIAILLQVLLKLTLKLEHHIAGYFTAHISLKMKIYRILSTWFVLFVSKFAILGILEFVYQDSLTFIGALHGAVPCIILVTVMLTAEYATRRIYRALA